MSPRHIPQIESVLLDAEGSVIASAMALARGHDKESRGRCDCRLCEAVRVYKAALSTWKELGGKTDEKRPRPIAARRRT